MAKTKITTGQYVNIVQPIASVGERITAQLVDFLILSLYTSFVSTIVLFAGAAFHAQDSTLVVLFFLFSILPAWLYQPLLEAFNKGRTLGKMMMGIKVADTDGSSPSIGKVIIRWLLLTVDVIFLLGLISMVCTRKNLRLGDLAAGTIVIKVKKGTHVERNEMLREFGFVAEQYRPFYRSVARLTSGQAGLISKTLALKSPSRDLYLNKLADKVMHTLRILPAQGATAQQFLFAVLNDYYYYSSIVEM